MKRLLLTAAIAVSTLYVLLYQYMQNLQEIKFL